jgi:hypothetical protein
VFNIENGAAGLWKSLRSFRDEWPISTTINSELTALIASFYGPQIPAKEMNIPEKEYSGKFTMQALTKSQRSDLSISGESTQLNSKRILVVRWV